MKTIVKKEGKMQDVEVNKKVCKMRLKRGN